MKEIFNIIKSNALFDGVGYSDFCSMHSCLGCQVKQLKNKELLFLAGDKVDMVGIVLSGSVQIIKDDFDGNRNIVAEIMVGEMFGEAFACAGVSHSPVTVSSNGSSKVLLFDFRRVITTCKSSCIHHNMLIENMLKIVALKNLFLNQKLEILSKKTIRNKLMCYFDYERKGSKNFTVPYSREELAAYIACDRSAMCAELSRMQKDGLIRYSKNTFEMI